MWTKMKVIPKTFYKMPSNCMHFLLAPLFLFVYVLVVDPFHVSEFLTTGGSSYTLNLTFVTLITIAVLSITRMLLFILRRQLRMTWAIYVLWSAGELVFTALFQTLYLAIVFAVIGVDIPLFEILTRCFTYFSITMIYPYTLLGMGVQLHYLRHREEEAVDDKSLIRFYDEYKKLRFIIAQEAVLYVKSEINYVNVHYLDSGKPRSYNLRSSMRALEESLTRHGLIRCHRSFFVNPEHIRLVRKDSSGFALAELDTPGLENVPISKSYYAAVAKFL